MEVDAAAVCALAHDAGAVVVADNATVSPPSSSRRARGRHRRTPPPSTSTGQGPHPGRGDPRRPTS
ncbi:MAG: hypothetical protein R2734_02900 [Nocardioides sp.]